jgi:uncharacterized protein YndB with AHSA1/START domain
VGEFEAESSARVNAPPSAIWALWTDPARWPEWNEGVRGAALDGELEAGAVMRVRMRRGGTVRYAVIALERERALVLEVRFPGARQVHEHRVETAHQGSEVTHRIRVTGALSPLWSLMLGRGRMRDRVAACAESERLIFRPGRRRDGRRA